MERKQIKAYQIPTEDGRYSESCFFADSSIKSEQGRYLTELVAYEPKNNIPVYRFDPSKKEHIENILGVNIQIIQGAPLESITRHPNFTPGIGSNLKHRQKADIARIVEEYRRVFSK